MQPEKKGQGGPLKIENQSQRVRTQNIFLCHRPDVLRSMANVVGRYALRHERMMKKSGPTPKLKNILTLNLVASDVKNRLVRRVWDVRKTAHLQTIGWRARHYPKRVQIIGWRACQYSKRVQTIERRARQYLNISVPQVRRCNRVYLLIQGKEVSVQI